MTVVTEALERIPQLRDELDRDDDELRLAIRLVERVLNRLRPGVLVEHTWHPSTFGETVLAFDKGKERWCITCRKWGEPSSLPTPLLSATRDVRAEAFRPQKDGVSPIEQLVIKVAETLGTSIGDRGPMLQVARRLLSDLMPYSQTEPPLLESR